MNIKKFDNDNNNMNINRNNYESFFLLYVDGELSKPGMQEVEAFAAKHPDLADELELLMDTRLTPDNDTWFDAKADLLKPEQWDADNLTPTQAMMLNLLHNADNSAEAKELAEEITHDTLLSKEWQLLQATRLPAEEVPMTHKHRLLKALPWDAEQLTPVQLQLLEAFENGSTIPAGVVADPELMKDWQLLQQTILPVATIEMPGKEKLYRSEVAKKTPVVRMGWWRTAAAAAVVAGIGWLVFNQMSTTVDPVKSGDTPQLSQQQKKTPAVTAPLINQVDTPATAQPAKENSLQQYAVNNEQVKQAPVKVQQAVVQKENIQPGNEEQERANLIAAYRLSAIDAQQLNTKPANDLNNKRANITALDYQNNLATTAVDNAGEGRMNASYAVMQDATPEDEYISIGGAKVNKQKLRNVFRTVTRKVTRSLDKSIVAPADEMAAELR